jgi:periplasmic protein CpxP/Spy
VIVAVNSHATRLRNALVADNKEIFMMTYVTSRKAALVPFALLGAVLLASPVFAQTASPQTEKVAPGSPTGNPERAASRGHSTPEQVHARITDLHGKLGITAAQEPQWKNVTDTMRDNAQSMEEASTTREKALQTMTVMDDLKSYETMATAHADGLHKLVAAFGPLYDSMSPAQKTAADTEFQGYRKRAAAQK